MKRCTWCGKSYPDEAVICAIDRERLEPVAPSGQSIPRLVSEEAEFISFECSKCAVKLRIHLPLSPGVLRCRRCYSAFRLHQISVKPLTYFVLPQSSPTSEPTITVDSALRIFGLSSKATLSEVRIAYRKLIGLYHPDKVAHLGKELRMLAESKTTEINRAHQILTALYTTDSED